MNETHTLADALRRVERPRPPSAFSNALVFGWRAVLKFKHVPEQLFDLVMTPIMFTLLFTYLFGGALEGSPTEYIQVLAADGRLTMTFNHFRPDYSTWEGAGPPMTLTLAESSAGHARFVRANDVSPDEIVYTLVGEELHVTVTGVDEPLVFRR